MSMKCLKEVKTKKAAFDCSKLSLKKLAANMDKSHITNNKFI